MLYTQFAPNNCPKEQEKGIDTGPGDSRDARVSPLLVTAVAGLTLAWRRLIEQHSLPIYRARELVAVCAGHVLVPALQWERSPRIVVKLGRLPTSNGVATRAIGNVAARGKLAAVRILVAAGTKFGRRPKIDVLQGRFQVGRAMAIRAGYPAVRAG